MTRVSPHQDRPKQMTRHASRSLSRASLSRWRGIPLLRISSPRAPPILRAPSWVPHSRSQSNSSRSKRETHSSRPYWSSPSIQLARLL